MWLKPRTDTYAIPSTGTLEALKWIAVVLMLGDHVDAVLLDRTSPVLYELGRIAFPLFTYVFAVNLARPGTDWQATYRRVMRRLLLLALLSVPFSVLAFERYNLLPANILFTLAAGMALVWCIRRNDIPTALLGSATFLLSGALVEFYWPGLIVVVAFWVMCAYRGWAAYAFALASVALLCLLNQNLFAFLVFPVIALVAWWKPNVPRLRWAFYIFYPTHLALLAALRLLMH